MAEDQNLTENGSSDDSLDDLPAQTMRPVREEQPESGATRPLSPEELIAADLSSPLPVDQAQTTPSGEQLSDVPDDLRALLDDRPRSTGSLIRRITGSLRRVTGSLVGLESAEDKEAEKPASKGKPKQTGDAYVSEIRQALASEAPPPKRARRTGELIGFITDRLKRATGSLRRAAGSQADETPAIEPLVETTVPLDAPSVPQPELPPSPEESYFPDVRLAAAIPDDTPDWIPSQDMSDPLAELIPEDFVFTPPEALESPVNWYTMTPHTAEEESSDFPEVLWEEGGADLYVRRADGEPPSNDVSDDDPSWTKEEISPPESDPAEDWMAALQDEPFTADVENLSEAVEPPPAGDDWMNEIRQAAAENEAERPVTKEPLEPEKPHRRRRITDPLVALITGGLKDHPNEPGGDPNRDLTDDKLIQRLERSMSARPGEPEQRPVLEETDLENRLSQIPSAADAQEEESPILNPSTPSSGTYTVFPTTETPLWEDTAPSETDQDPPTISAEGFRRRAGYDPNTMDLPPITSPDDALAIEHLTGEVPLPPVEVPKETLLQVALSEARNDARQEEEMTADQLRLVVLEGAQPEPQSLEQIEEAVEAVARPKNWFSQRTWIERLLLLEAGLVILAALIVVPIFVSAILRGPTEMPNTFQPRPLPAGVPYPVAIELPGGWDFPLGKSTFRENQWRPAQAEWLEGTEIRRVVALPWNEQTEAVIMTFRPGDPVSIALSNEDLIRYEVTSIERVAIDDTTVYFDRRPSLAIILFKEDADERWVVICKK